jgi:transposase
MNEHHGLSPSGCSGLILIALIVIVAVAITWIAGALSDLNNSQAQAELARAERIHQEGRADHQASLDWQHEFMLWTAYIQSQQFGIGCLLGPAAALLALASGYALGRALSAHNVD